MHHAYIIPITHSNAHARCLGACPVWEEGLTLTPSFRDKGKKEWGVIYTGDGKERGREKEMVAYSESCRSPGPSSAQMDSIFYTRVGACCATFAACLASLVIICYFVCLRLEHVRTSPEAATDGRSVGRVRPLPHPGTTHETGQPVAQRRGQRRQLFDRMERCL